MRKLIFTIILVFFFSASSLFAKREVEIEFWHSLGFNIKGIIEDMANDYNRSHPGIKVNPVFQGLFEDMQVKMLTAAVTHQLPDVAQVQVEYLDPYIENGLIEPINNIISKEDRDDILDIMWGLVSRDGEIYAVPFCISTTVFFYNEDAFRKEGLDPDSIPLTWEDLIKMGKILTKDTNGDGVIDKYAMMFWTDGFYGIMPFLWANGGKLFSDDGKRIILTSKEMVKTIEMLMDLIFKEKIMPQNWTDWESGQAFLSGNLAMGPFTSAAISYGEQNLPWTLRIGPMPSINGKRYTVLGGSAMVNFSTNRKKKKIVNDFISWSVSKENTIRIHKSTGYIPVRKSALKSLDLKAFHKKNPNYLVPVQSLEYARPLPVHAEYLKMNEMVRDMLQRIILNRADIAEELARTEKEINAMLE
jgi:sn-glycerol 3-phosphate transport system substrate-binding protein